MAGDANGLKMWHSRPMDQIVVNKDPESLARERIVENPRVCGGRACVRGTRIRVTDILMLLAHGASRAEILEDYPDLIDEDVTAALAFAAKTLEKPTSLLGAENSVVQR
jgi:uncharacterized protein (DUF433 family)